ncbi:DUF167 domain-containing protein [Spirosoma rhododendri]|uniref:UPF0235 protein HH216_06805 n=1 Tax=Spirosoma rhododendri TaxID=2728024 RepID=A0A7L5DIF2_9BACT|nr:DUF167 domain-containing protein [Spirosoma rhododendri]QJD78164.1 DUF167 domain-containing protein [Spirosoma rhododendri]
MIVSLKVKPGSKIDQFTIDAAGLLTVKLKAPAQDGRANAYLVELLARELHVPKSAITITAGFTSPHKRLEIDVSAERYSQFLARIRG